MSACKIHNIRFYNPEPVAIRCMAVHESSKTLAISRADATIELWNLKHTWFIEKTIPPTTENCTIEAIRWCSNRLFSVGLHGLLVEYNLKKLCEENRWFVTGEAAFSLDVTKDNQKLAIGTEQGYLNLFSVEADGINFNKLFDKQEGRILCLKFDSSGEFIATGSLDVIRIWNVQSGHAIHKLSTGRNEANKPTIVWSIDITDDFTIVSGDSRGRLTFWDGKLGSQIESYQTHKADILTVRLSENQKSLYCAGVDPLIISYEKITMKNGTNKWVKSIQRKIHEHDVNALILVDDKLYSGGADSYLVCSFYPPKTLLKAPPLLQSPCVHVARNARLFLLRYTNYLELWSFGQTETIDTNYRGFVPVKNLPRKLLRLQRVPKGEERGEGIYCTSISNDGKWLIYSTCLGVSLFRLVHDSGYESLELVKIDCLDNDDVPCLRSTFTTDSSQLITCSNNGELRVYKLFENTIDTQQIISTSDKLDTVTFLLNSSCSKYLIVGDVRGNIIVFKWNNGNKKWLNHCTLPCYKNPPVCMNIHPKTLNLVVVYSDMKLIEYNVLRKEFTPFSRRFGQNDLKSRLYPIRNITFDERSENVIILHDDSNIIVVNKGVEKSRSKIPGSKLARMENGLKEDCGKFKLSLVKKYKHLVHMEWLDGNELMVVEMNPLNILEQLPPVFVQNVFGKK